MFNNFNNPQTAGSQQQTESEEATADQRLISPPAITIPKGGGAIRGIDEKFSVSPTTGTASLTVPIYTSPGRSDFHPRLSVSYDSGAGNGPFGFGWSLSTPSIARKTTKGLPRYRNGDEEDVFILSGAEDLVPAFKKKPNGEWELDADGHHVIDEEPMDGYMVRRYRPRIEGLFARIERCTNLGDETNTFWRSISKDNITTWYGKSPESRIFDPTAKTHIYSWLICQSYDDKGNAILYEYEEENSDRIFEDEHRQPVTWAHERNRHNESRSSNRYLKRIKYGNQAPNRDLATWQATDPAQLPVDDWMFEVIFDYGEEQYSEDDPDSLGQIFAQAQLTPAFSTHWPARRDPFSDYRAGFEIRTYRLCRRVLMVHHFPQELGNPDYLVRSTEFAYAESPIASFITSVTQSGYVLQPPPSQPNRYLKKSLPPLEFEYSQADLKDAITEVDPRSLENLPSGLDGADYRFVDLDGEGLSGVLTEQAGSWFYKPNLGDGNFGSLKRVAERPSLANLKGTSQQLLDLAGDGQLDLVDFRGSAPGFYERTHDQQWETFTPFVSLPNVPWDDPNLRFVDLTGDGHADILITTDEAVVWHLSLSEAGFDRANQVHQALNEEVGPRLVFADGNQSIYLADLSGDGLVDLVRIGNGEVCYWPNLGYGRFGAKVTMDNAPRFDYADQFDQQRIRLSDVDGSGTTDVIYLGRDTIEVYRNQAGNSWSDPETLSSFPRVDNLSSVLAVDLLGNGTACLVWSSPLPSAKGQLMRYIDLMGGQKPHLLISVKNNLGAETHVRYRASTHFYLQDKEAGKPWITKLPFPVQVVECVETYDSISDNRFVTCYAYHHGYFDGFEREFRGFGLVEQRDTEEFSTLNASKQLPVGTNVDEASHVPPVLTKTWYHTGIYLGRDRVSNFFAGLIDAQDRGEYYREPAWLDDDNEARAHLIDDTILPDGLTVEEEREACRALKGSMLRQEVYAMDGSGTEDYPHGHPYTVTEQNFSIAVLQPRGDNRHAVFFTHPRETISYQYERNPTDPRIGHALTLEVDGYGNVLKSAAIGYGRRQDDPNLPLQADRDKQSERLITYTENGFTDAIDNDEDNRTPLPCETRTYELTGYTPSGAAGRYQIFDFVQPDPNGRLVHTFDSEINYEEKPTIGEQRRLIEHVRMLYRPDDLGDSPNDDPLTLLPLEQMEPMALSGEAYKLAFTPGLLAKVYERPLDVIQPPGAPPPDPLLPDPATVLPVDDAAGISADRGGYLSSQALRDRSLFPADPADPFWTLSDTDDHWWMPSGRVFFSPGSADTSTQERAYARQHFFLPHRYRDPLNTSLVSTESSVSYDAYDLLLVETRDAVDNVVKVTTEDDDEIPALRIDYRVLQPYWVTDPNGNRTQVSFDALGMVEATAVMGKPGENLGDLMEDVDDNPPLAELQNFIADPAAQAESLLGKATTRIVYDLARYQRADQPPFAATLARETHHHDLGGDQTKIQVSFSYSDGFGREIQKKIQAEEGDAPRRQSPVDLPSGDIRPGELVRDAQGDLVRDAQGDLVQANTPHRWVGSGRTVFNNKGKPVRQYEPFFNATHLYEPEREMTDTGVSPVLFYDPVERVVATLHPNHTYEKVVFDPWQQTTYDVNDTANFDPRTDDDVKRFLLNPDDTPRIPTEEYLPTWHQLRTDPSHVTEFERSYPDAADRLNQKDAADKVAGHADTPTKAHFDTLGRPFLTVAHNRFERNGAVINEKYPTRVELDIEGNQRVVRDAIEQNGDAHGRIVMRYDYDMQSKRIHQASMEAGERWMLNDVTGKPIRAWDGRGHHIVTAYDALRRPVEQYVRGTTADSDPRTLNQNILVDRIEYGEGRVNPEALNLRTRIYQHYDSAGVVIKVGQNPNSNRTEAYDFKGNLLRSTRRLVSDYMAIPDWLKNPGLDNETFVGSTRYDALNRPIQSVVPHSSLARVKLNIIQPVFNESNLLEGVDVWLGRSAEPADRLDRTADVPSHVGVSNIDYDAKGQRQRIDYKNGASTFYDYDPFTFRLVHLVTKRDPANFPHDCPQPPPVGWPGCQVQNLHYSHDPAGNITHIRDDAQQTIYFKNQRVEPSNDYTYDAVYRLIEATGREHLGQIGGSPIPHSHNDAGRVGLLSADAAGRFAPNDGNAMDRYCKKFVYDAVGNFLEMSHHRSCPSAPSWRRTYAYAEASLIEDGTGGTLLKTNNRLSSTTIGNNNPLVEPYLHDVHGNMIRMPHLGGGLPGANMHWTYKDQLWKTDLGGGGTAYYVYDASGQRVRKVWEKAPGLTEERIYLGGFEIFRRHAGAIGASTATLERETLHIMDDKQRIALVETRTHGNDGSPTQLIRYEFGNHLGSASLELDDQAEIISYEEYFPYGSTTYQAVRNQTETPKRYRYTGKERDEETGLYYYGARYYAAWLGRWTAADPAGLIDGPNRYVSARNNPVSNLDRMGMATVQAQLNDVVDYGDKVGNKAKLGQNVQKDHIIAQEKIKQMRTDPSGKTHYKPKADPTVVVETGKATSTSAAKPHTQKTFHDPQADVKEIKRLKNKGISSITRDIVDPSRQAAIRSGMKAESVDKAIWGQLDNLHSSQTLSETSKTLAGNVEAFDDIDWDATFMEDPKSPPAKAAPDLKSNKGGKVKELFKSVANRVAENPRLAKAGAKLAKAGKQFAKAIPFLGVGAGVASAGYAASQGDKVGAALDTVGLVPGVGDVVDAARGGYALGEAVGELLVDSDKVMSYGEVAMNAAKKVGLGETGAAVVGGMVAAESAVLQAAAKLSPISWFF